MYSIKQSMTKASIIGFMAVLLFSCVDEVNIVPALPSSPSGGVSGLSITRVEGSRLSFCVDIFAIDHFGGFITGLDGNCLTYENTDGSDLIFVGIEQRVTPDKGPYSAQMIFDQSGSIGSTDPLDARVDAGLAFVDIMSGADEASIAVFASGGSYPQDVTRLTPFTQDKNVLREQIEDMRGRHDGGTPLYFSIFSLLDEASTEANNNNQAIIVFTDGEDTNSSVSISNLIAEANARGIEVYTVGLGSGIGQEVLTNIALSTGGSVMFAEEVTQLVSLYRSLADLLRGGSDIYNVCYDLDIPGRVWRSGDRYTVNLRMQLPTGEVVNFPVVLFIP